MEQKQNENVKATAQTKVKDWYKTEYNSDELGDSIDDNITFFDLFELLDGYKEIYSYLVDDSVVRERCFAQLAVIMECDYSYIYDQWLLGA